MALDPLERRIAHLLVNHGASPEAIVEYIDDIFQFSNRTLYEEADDQSIILDYEDWLEN